MSNKRLLFASSEVYPFVKTGGLADVSHSLPKALNRTFDVCVVLPLYRQIDRERFGIHFVETFELSMGETTYSVEVYKATFEEIEYRFVYEPLLCERDFLYGPSDGGYEDNAIRFALFSRAIIRILQNESFALAHLNDWQCALAALLAKEDPAIAAKIVYTIHNLAYQGVFPASVLSSIGVDKHYFTMEGLEFYNQVNFMKAGIAYADAITTVSPTYAKEILTQEYGCGLEGFLQVHRRKLKGILNGIDTEHFSPLNDSALIEPFSTAKGKKGSKTALLKELGLKGSSKPLFVFIGRFAHQKGMDLLIESLPKIAAFECNVALLGEGENGYHEALEAIAREYPNIVLKFGYDEAFSRRMYAAADFFLMPSLFEPCGLSQMIAFAYGAVPIASRVGGLADTVKQWESYDETSPLGYGIVFNSLTPRAFLSAIKKGCDVYREKKHFESVVNHNMQCDYSWAESAYAYEAVYQRLIR